MEEKWIRWRPIDGLSEKYRFESITHSLDGFEMIFSEVCDERRRIRVFFYDVDLYRTTREPAMHRLVRELSVRYGDDFCGRWTFFKVENSEYTAWAMEESQGIYEAQYFPHYSFITANAVIDIVSNEPTVEFLS